MITNHDYSDAPLFNIDSTEKQIVITIKDKPDTITNDNLYDVGLQLEESLCSEPQLKFGSCEAAQVRFSIDTQAVAYSLEGKTIYIKMYLDGHSANLLNIGTYKVESDQKDANTEQRTIIAYDALKEIHEADVSDWYNTLLPNDNSTTTISAMRASFFSHFGVTEEVTTLVNDAMTVHKTFSTPLTGRTVISAICEANGVFGHINRDGKFVYLNILFNVNPLYPSDTLYPSDDLYPSDGHNRILSAADEDGGYTSGEFENFSVQKITQLEILAETGDVGQTIGADPSNIYTISDNALFFGMSAADLTTYGTNIFNVIKDVTYVPYSLECLGNPCFEVGDGIICQTYNGIVKSFILRRTLTGAQSLTDEYEALGEANYTRELNSIRFEVQQERNRGNILQRDVDQTMSEIYDQYGYSRITQNANAITSEVSRAEGAEGGLSSRITQNASDILACVKKDTDYSGIEISIDGIKVRTTAGTYVIDSTNFTVDEYGYVTASGVDLTGYINATSGKIGNFDITNNNLYLMSHPIFAYGSGDQSINIGSTSFSTYISGFDMLLSAGYSSINFGGLAPRLSISGSHGIRLQGRSGNNIYLGDDDGDGGLSSKLEIIAPNRATYYDGSITEDVVWRSFSNLGAGDYVLASPAG